VAKYLLVTGATGLLGRFLLRDLLVENGRLAVIVRAGKKQSANERIEAILQRWEGLLGRELSRPVVIEGDITQPELGVTADWQDWIRENCDAALHLAATLTFHNSDRSQDPWLSNVTGTQNMLDLCRKNEISDFHYCSTAYVCGARTDLVKEDELNVGQTFRNDYEQSKLEAETMVRQADFIEKLTVYRPAVVAGDSVTGYTNTYHGLYMYLKLMSVLVMNTEPGEDGRRFTPVQLEMTGDEPRNIIPADWTSQVMAHLLSNPEHHGNTYHLAPEHPTTPREVINAGYKYFNSYGVEFVGNTKIEEFAAEIDKQAHENKGMYEPYETSDPQFDLTNLKAAAPHLPCPKIDEAMLHRFWKYGEEDRWGKRREQEPKIDAWVEDALPQCANFDAGQNANVEFTEQVGLDITGPGGGQFTLQLTEDGAVRLKHGLPETDSVVSISASAFLSQLGGEACESDTLVMCAETEDNDSSRLIDLLNRGLFQNETVGNVSK